MIIDEWLQENSIINGLTVNFFEILLINNCKIYIYMYLSAVCLRIFLNAFQWILTNDFNCDPYGLHYIGILYNCIAFDHYCIHVLYIMMYQWIYLERNFVNISVIFRLVCAYNNSLLGLLWNATSKVFTYFPWSSMVFPSLFSLPFFTVHQYFVFSLVGICPRLFGFQL